MTAGDVSVGKEVAINKSETGDEQGDSTIFEELLLSKDQEVGSELDGISLDTLRMYRGRGRRGSNSMDSCGVILYFAIASGLLNR